MIYVPFGADRELSALHSSRPVRSDVLFHQPGCVRALTRMDGRCCCTNLHFKPRSPCLAARLHRASRQTGAEALRNDGVWSPPKSVAFILSLAYMRTRVAAWRKISHTATKSIFCTRHNLAAVRTHVCLVGALSQAVRDPVRRGAERGRARRARRGTPHATRTRTLARAARLEET